MRDFLEEMGALLGILGLAFGFIAVLGLILYFPANWLNNKQCKAQYSEYNPQYRFMSGCRIMYDGKLTPVDMIKNINLEK